MLAKLRELGEGALGIGVMLGLAFVIVVVLKGTAAVGAWAYPFLSALTGFTTVFGLPILILLSLIRPSRGIASAGLSLASYVYGVTLWIWSFLFTLQTWGWIAVMIGFFLAGIGAVPIAMLAALTHGQWSILGQLVLGLVLTIGCRLLALFVASKAADAALSSRPTV